MELLLFALLSILRAETPEPLLYGTISDPTSAAIAGARVKVEGPASREAVSGHDGSFRFEGMPAGDYTVTVEKAGFEPVRKYFSLEAAEVRFDVALSPATLRQTIEVSAAPELLGEAVTKIPGTLHETPRAATVYSSEELRERNVRSIPELLAFVPGMSPNSMRNGGYHFYARGFRMGPSDTRVDGFAGINIGGGFGASLFGIEQAVVLRGPAGLQYGANGSPGGFINLITKKPQPVRSTRLDLRTGGYAGTGVALTDRPSISFDFDSTGALTPGGRILYRTLLTAENQNYFTDGVLDKGRYLNASLTFKLDKLGLYSLTPVFQYAGNLRPAGGGIVVSPGTSLSANDGLDGPIQLSDLSPHRVNLSSGFQNYLARQAGFDFRGIPTPRLALNASYRAIRNDRHINQFTPAVSTAAQLALLRDRNELLRTQSKSEADNRYQNVDFNASYELQGNSWRSTIQSGAYTLIAGTRTTSLLGPAPAAAFPIHIYTGRGVAAIDLAPAMILPAYSFTTNWNGYLQNRTSLFRNKLVLSMGLGYGQSHPGGAPVRKGNLMPNYAAVVNVTQSIALYGSYSSSFNPVDPTLQNVAGLPGTFSPTTGNNYEAGAKFDLPHRRASATLSFFRNSISNALVQTGINDVNANGVRYYVEAGTRKGQGVELSSDVRVRRDLFVNAAASFTDAIYTGTGPASAAATLAIPGSRAEKTPRWSWNARTTYERPEGALAGLGMSFALLWQDQRLGSNGARTFAAPDPLMLPAYTRADASLFYRLNRHTDIALNLENVTDRRIFLNATTGAAIEMAAPRTATLRLSYRF